MVQEILNRWAQELETQGIETAVLDTQLLMGQVLGVSRAQVLARLREPISSEALKTFETLAKKRLAGWNLAYLLGTKEFMGLEFRVDQRVLVPRPDTETLVEASLEWLRDFGGAPRVLDLCTGSGAIAASVKHYFPTARVGASDLSTEALALARDNFYLNQVAVETWVSDLLDQVPGTWDLILSNPPYLTPEETADCMVRQQWKEPTMALNGFDADGLGILRRLIPQAYERLNSGGAVMMEAAPGQMPALTQLLSQAGFQQIKIYKDLEARDRVIQGNKLV